MNDDAVFRALADAIRRHGVDAAILFSDIVTPVQAIVPGITIEVAGRAVEAIHAAGAFALGTIGTSHQKNPVCGDEITLRARVDEMHKQMFGHTAPGEPVEIVSYRVRGVGRVPEVKLSSSKPEGRALRDALRETRPARFNGVTVQCPVYQREKLDVGHTFAGPAIVDQLDATTVIPPGHAAQVDPFKNILIRTEKA